MQIRGTRVEIARGATDQHSCRNDVYQQPGCRDAEHQSARNRLRFSQSRDRLPENPPGDEKKCRAVDESGENFPAQISVRFFRCAWLPAEPGDEQRQPECGDVSEHVTGIGQQRN